MPSSTLNHACMPLATPFTIPQLQPPIAFQIYPILLPLEEWERFSVVS